MTIFRQRVHFQAKSMCVLRVHVACTCVLHVCAFCVHLLVRVAYVCVCVFVLRAHACVSVCVCVCMCVRACVLACLRD